MPAKPGRPPGPTDETRQKVLDAAFRLLGTEGPSALTPVRIHSESGVARTTVYRHWPDPADIVEEILGPATHRHELDHLTGDLLRDLEIALDTLITRFETRPVARFYRATLEHGRPGEVPSLAQRYIAGLTEPVRSVLAEAVGDRRVDGDVDEMTAELCGPLLFDHLLLGRPVDRTRVGPRLSTALRRVTSSTT